MCGWVNVEYEDCGHLLVGARIRHCAMCESKSFDCAPCCPQVVFSDDAADIAYETFPLDNSADQCPKCRARDSSEAENIEDINKEIGETLDTEMKIATANGEKDRDWLQSLIEEKSAFEIFNHQKRLIDDDAGHWEATEVFRVWRAQALRDLYRQHIACRNQARLDYTECRARGKSCSGNPDGISLVPAANTALQEQTIVPPEFLAEPTETPENVLGQGVPHYLAGLCDEDFAFVGWNPQDIGKLHEHSFARLILRHLENPAADIASSSERQARTQTFKVQNTRREVLPTVQASASPAELPKLRREPRRLSR